MGSSDERTLDFVSCRRQKHTHVCRNGEEWRPQKRKEKLRETSLAPPHKLIWILGTYWGSNSLAIFIGI